MTQFRQGNGRHIEEQFRSKGPPRIPRLPPERRQMPITALAIWIIFIIAAGAVIYSRF